MERTTVIELTNFTPTVKIFETCQLAEQHFLSLLNENTSFDQETMNSYLEDGCYLSDAYDYQLYITEQDVTVETKTNDNNQTEIETDLGTFYVRSFINDDLDFGGYEISDGKDHLGSLICDICDLEDEESLESFVIELEEWLNENM